MLVSSSTSWKKEKSTHQMARNGLRTKTIRCATIYRHLIMLFAHVVMVHFRVAFFVANITIERCP